MIALHKLAVSHLCQLIVQSVNIANQRINHYPVDRVACFVNDYPLDNELSSGLRYNNYSFGTTDRKYIMDIDFKCLHIMNGFHIKIPYTKRITNLNQIELIARIPNCVFYDGNRES